MRKGNKLITVTLATCLSVGMLSFAALPQRSTTNVLAATETILNSDHESAREDCVILGIRGRQKATDASSVLERINQMRYEACQEGVINPETGQKLTSSDYVQLQWSSDMAEIAKYRAAEASIFRERTRPNGDSWNSVESSNGKKTYGENLGWNNEADMMSVVNTWYEEKSTWLSNPSGGVASSYTDIISPSNRYVGMSQFINTSAAYSNTVVAEFSRETDLKTDMNTDELACIQKTEIKKTYANISSASYTVRMANGTSKTIYPEIRVSTDTCKGTLVLPGSGVWSSSDEKVATITSDGVATAAKVGTTTLKAVMDDGTNLTITLIVTNGTVEESTEAPAVTAAPTATATPTPTPTPAAKVELTESNARVALSAEEYVYDGTEKKPAIVVTDLSSGEKAVESTNYDILYDANCVESGRHTIVITFKGDYSGTLRRSYIIKPMAVANLKVTAKKKKLVVRWSNQSGIVTGYELQYNKNSSFASSLTPKKVVYGDNDYVFTKMKTGKRFYVRVRSYKMTDSETLFSDWTTVRSGKVK